MTNQESVGNTPDATGPLDQPVGFDQLKAHLADRHPGIRLAQPHGMYPEGRPHEHLEAAHDMQHERFPDAQDHSHQEPISNPPTAPQS
jgi:hypothetical protein